MSDSGEEAQLSFWKDTNMWVRCCYAAYLPRKHSIQKEKNIPVESKQKLEWWWSGRKGKDGMRNGAKGVIGHYFEFSDCTQFVHACTFL